MTNINQIASGTAKTAQNSAAQLEMDPAAVARQLRDLLQQLILLAPTQTPSSKDAA